MSQFLCITRVAGLLLNQSSTNWMLFIDVICVQFLNYNYPNIISNENLYKRCNTEPLSARVDRNRWRMLGHVLRGPIDGPAYSSLIFAVNTLQYQGRRGRPQSNLFSLILHDLSVRELHLNNLHDLNYLRFIALDRAQWRRMQ